MTDLHSKRKYAGETHTDKRRGRAPETERLPPHKKPKVWGLSLTWTETITRTLSQDFPSRAARDEARRRIERHFREQALKQKTTRQRYYDWHGYYNSPLYQFKEGERQELKAGPFYTETYEEVNGHPTSTGKEP